LTILYRQDSWFNYLFGVKEGGFYGAISLSNGKSVLFMPRLPDSYRIWCGAIYPPEYFKEMYGTDEVHFSENLSSWLEETLANEGKDAKVHILRGINSDSGKAPRPIDGIDHFQARGLVETNASQLPSGETFSLLYYLLSISRMYKSAPEIEVMRYCAYVGSNAHVEVMRSIQSFHYEYEIEAKFLYEIYSKGGCRKSAYISICACGPNSSVLHYGHAGAPNDRRLLPTDLVH
jgi:Xaa-Pro dipeptidase